MQEPMPLRFTMIERRLTDIERWWQPVDRSERERIDERLYDLERHAEDTVHCTAVG